MTRTPIVENKAKMYKTVGVLLFMLLGWGQSLFCQDTMPAGKGAIEIFSKDAFLLHGDFVAGKTGAPGILFIPMCNVGQRSDYNSIIDKFQKQGMFLLSFDFRGHGDSVNEEYDVKKDLDGFWDRENGMIMADIEAAYQYLVSQPGVDTTRIAVFAASCGVKRALQLTKTTDNIKLLVLLSGQASPDGLAYLRAHKEIPVMGIASEDDGNGIAAEWIRNLGEETPHPNSTTRIFKTGGHGTELFLSQETLEEDIVKWVKINLVIRP